MADHGENEELRTLNAELKGRIFSFAFPGIGSKF